MRDSVAAIANIPSKELFPIITGEIHRFPSRIP
jgi:hypothetical protein